MSANRDDKRRPRVVVINDDTDFLTLMSELLTELGEYDVEICREGDRAYQFVRDQMPDLVILDIRIEGQEAGWAILECLTLDPQTKPIPLIVCSAAIRELHEHEDLFERYGIDVLSKPFDLDTLLEKVAAALQRGERNRGGGPA
jgi:CheY-like chemotaxis protein